MRVRIDKSQARRIAGLARLEFDDSETTRLAAGLAEIIDYVRQIERLDTSGVEPFSHQDSVTETHRANAPRHGLSLQQALAEAPDAFENCFRVPTILPHKTPTRRGSK